ncbi:putative lipid kinase [Wickerhamomyces ciferrii]|uniref:Lipid kinase n=1 Tax=Wickerhamomyces ciferrii (strain ATCC 14091 / BCRC 22168 / CBS 111 / JCM 3599 / NBRC 0793 / NRRL Y-1031 F-60-10) TaxID=1206466 RepID=K0KLH1_WICCF|nr:putative lipid kinase [Wickerhamomyces ciferrii]CCH43821.1 putative lipid kinase [Wickerhamomyces ciferrii]
MSDEREEYPLFTIQKENETFHYFLSYQKTEVSNINFQLVNKPNGEESSSTIINKDNLPEHFKNGIDIVVIDSVNSGIGRKNRDIYQSVIKPIFDQLDIQHTYLKTTSSDSITDFAKTLDLTKEHTILLISGDTSIIELINGLPKEQGPDKHDLNLILIPLGTGNALVSSAGVFSEVDAIKNIFSHDKSSFPLYEAQFPQDSYAPYLNNRPIDKVIFSIVISWGCHAQMVYRAEAPELRPLGVERFKIAAAEMFKGKLDYNCDIVILEGGQEKRFTESTIHKYSSILAVPRLEKNYNVSPDSQLKKSELHVLEFGDIPLPEFIGLLHEPYKGRAHVDHEKTIYEAVQPGREIILRLNEEDEERSVICADGISVKVKNALGKEVKIRFLSSDDLNYKLNLVGLA